jgi:hypothetical protein
LRCKLVVYLPHGTITARVLGTAYGNHATGTITGGTGSYAGAHGPLVWKDLNNAGTKVQYTLTIK